MRSLSSLGINAGKLSKQNFLGFNGSKVCLRRQRQRERESERERAFTLILISWRVGDFVLLHGPIYRIVDVCYFPKTPLWSTIHAN